MTIGDDLKLCSVCGTMKHIPNGLICARCWAPYAPGARASGPRETTWTPRTALEHIRRVHQASDFEEGAAWEKCSICGAEVGWPVETLPDWPPLPICEGCVIEQALASASSGEAGPPVRCAVTPLREGEANEGALESTDLFLEGRGVQLLANVPAGQAFTYSLSVDGHEQAHGTVGEGGPPAQEEPPEFVLALESGLDVAASAPRGPEERSGIQAVSQVQTAAVSPDSAWSGLRKDSRAVQNARAWLAPELDEGDCRFCGCAAGEYHEPTDPCGIVAGLLGELAAASPVPRRVDEDAAELERIIDVIDRNLIYPQGQRPVGWRDLKAFAARLKGDARRDGHGRPERREDSRTQPKGSEP